MSRLLTQPNLDNPDDIYEQLIKLHAGCSTEQSLRVNARLILLLANHIGDQQVIIEAIGAASGPTNSTPDS
jgi:hypothetical protein